jgi:hypothetical protein
VDMGLPSGKPLPPLQSRRAAELTRRVMIWDMGSRARRAGERDGLAAVSAL